MQQRINYSQCWEDPRILIEALDIKPDDSVLSITSGGDNTLALLFAGAGSVTSVDFVAAQNDLLERKINAAKRLGYDEFLKFLGVGSTQGIIHSGRLEKFISAFRRFVLPLIHSKKTIEAFFACSSLEAQGKFYDEIWNSRRWRFFFRRATSRFALKHFARQPGMFTYADTRREAEGYLQRIGQRLTLLPLSENFFLQYSLLGTYTTALPPYLEEKNFPLYKTLTPKLNIVTANLMEYLAAAPDKSFSKFNLSDIFEALSPEQNTELWKQIIRTAKPNARIAYWNNIVPRSYPSELAEHIRNETSLARELYAKDRAYFYSSFNVHTITT